VEVRVGGKLFGHNIEAPHVIERGVPSAVSISVNAERPTDCVLVIDKVFMFEFKFT
jgi:hypothetical protein